MSKIQSNRSDKKLNAKKVMSLCPENLNENLVSMMTCVHNIYIHDPQPNLIPGFFPTFPPKEE